MKLLLVLSALLASLTGLNPAARAHAVPHAIAAVEAVNKAETVRDDRSSLEGFSAIQLVMAEGWPLAAAPVQSPPLKTVRFLT